MTIDLPLWSMWNKNWYVVKGEIVDVAPHIKCATFAVHKHKHPEFGMCFKVSNIETGSFVGNGIIGVNKESKRLAIAQAASLLSFYDDKSIYEYMKNKMIGRNLPMEE